MARRRKREAKQGKGKLWVQAEVTSLEMASGHDGLLRGAPEPALLLAVYRVGGAEAAALVGRAQVVFHPLAGAFPAVARPDGDDGIVKVRAPLDGTQRIALLAVALERDGGRDLAEIYAALSDAGTLRLWEEGTAVPSPVALEELAAHVIGPEPRRVHAILAGKDLDASCDDDELVGTCFAVRPRTRCEEDLRLAFVSADRVNDWTAVLRLSIR